MNDIKNRLRHWRRATSLNWPFVAVCVVFGMAASWHSAVWFAHQINPDATSYFTIAEKYARLDIHQAVNGYWGPLLSWLLVPAVWIRADLSVAARLTSALAGLGVLVAVYIFLRSRQVSRSISTSLSALLAVSLAGWILTGPITPDLLMTLLVVLTAFQLLRFLDHPTTRRGIGLGLLGAAMYFCKGFGLYLFVTLIGLTGLWQLRQTAQPRTVLRRFAPTIIVFAALCLPFIGLLSVKYHRLTISNASTYVQRAFGPARHGSQPMQTMGPLAPPNDSATSIWEDPSLTIPLMPAWSPLGSSTNLNYFLQNIVEKNLDAARQGIADAGGIVSLGVLIVVLGCFGRSPFRREYALFAGVGALQVGGYALVLVETRYLWSLMILGVVALGLWLSTIQRKALLGTFQIILGAAIFLAIMFIPLQQAVTSSHTAAEQLYAQAQGLGRLVPPGAHVIADNFAEYYPCYYEQWRCYAVLQTPPPHGETAWRDQLKSFGITYLIDYHARDQETRLVAFIHDSFTLVGTVATNGLPPVTVYKLR